LSFPPGLEFLVLVIDQTMVTPLSAVKI
jgi:hypothetical protein